MASTSKKALLRRHDGVVLAGYLPAAGFVRSGEPPSHAGANPPAPRPETIGEAGLVDLLDLAGRTVPVPLADVKTISFVRDFNLDDPVNPERLSRRSFLARPRSEGLWLRVTFLDGDQLEGLAPLDLSLLDTLLTDSGLILTPPDDRTNTHRIFVPRCAITALQLLAVITTPSRPRPTRPESRDDSQADLFPR